MNVRKLLKSRFVGFSLVGLLVLIFGFVLLALLVEVLHMDKVVAGAVTTVISVNLNFFANKYLNWSDRPGNFFIQWWKFIITRIGVIIVNQLLYSLAVLVGFNYLLVTLILTLITTLINYFGNDKYVFLTTQKKGAMDDEGAAVGFDCDSRRR